MNPKHVLFIYSLNTAYSLSKPLIEPLEMQFGISYISAVLLKNGYQTKLLVLNRDSDLAIVDAHIKEFSPRLICCTAVATEYAFIEGIAQHIKKTDPDIFLMMGGVHVSLNPDEAMLKTFDALCLGEGEGPVLELMRQLEKDQVPSGIANLWIRRGEEIEKNSLRPFLEDLDSLPFPDREMWQEWVLEKDSRFGVLLARGCPFNCTYCCNHALRKLTTGPYLRYRSVENIVAEIVDLAQTYPQLKEVYLEVETIGAAKNDWAIALCSRLAQFNAARGKPISFGVNLRVAKYHADLEDLFAAFQKSNFRHINIGLESGSERVRAEVLKRHYTNEDIIKTVQLARKYGLEVWFYNLIGLPGETLQDFQETIRMNRICQPDFHYLSIFYPYPGTELYALCKERGLIADVAADKKIERISAPLDLPEFSKREIEKQFSWFDYLVYRDFRPRDKLLTGVVGNYHLIHSHLPGYQIKVLLLKDVLNHIIQTSDYFLLGALIKKIFVRVYKNSKKMWPLRRGAVSNGKAVGEGRR